LKIALDYDGTYTADPVLWTEFIRMARASGHEVVIVTSRSPQERIWTDVPVVYCSRTAKRRHFTADVWIDDMPKWIVEDMPCGF
jgi:hypothetical protein